MPNTAPNPERPNSMFDTSLGEPIEAISSDGVRIVGHRWGGRDKPAILFVHGFNQAEMCWAKQIASPLRDSFQLVTYDLRGHGGSGKPAVRSAYRDAQIWSDDLSLILDAAGVDRAVFVAWSMGGRVVMDYLRLYGLGRAVGLNLVGVGAVNRPELKGTGGLHLFPMIISGDLAENIAGTIEFARLCFAVSPTEAEMAEIIAYNMVVPAEIREMIIGMPNQDEAFVRTVDIPALVSFGTADVLNKLEAGRVAAEVLPRGQLSEYEGIGHSPFFEAPERFNAELAAFATAAWQAAPEAAS